MTRVNPMKIFRPRARADHPFFPHRFFSFSSRTIRPAPSQCRLRPERFRSGSDRESCTRTRLGEDRKKASVPAARDTESENIGEGWCTSSRPDDGARRRRKKAASPSAKGLPIYGNHARSRLTARRGQISALKQSLHPPPPPLLLRPLLLRVSTRGALGARIHQGVGL